MTKIQNNISSTNPFDSLGVYRAIIDTMHDGVFGLRDGVMIYANASLLRMTGYNKEQLLGQSTFDLVAPEDRDMVKNRYFRRLKGEALPDEYEFDLLHADGKTRISVSMTVSVIETEEGEKLSIGTLKDISSLQVLISKLTLAAHSDPLTGLNNRLYFDRELPRAIARSKRTSNMMALLYLDLDGFKMINDTLGHQAGDEVLCEVSNRLKYLFRETDWFARIGGDEFIVVLENTMSSDNAYKMAEKVLNELGKPIQLSEGSTSIGASIGIAIYPDNGGEADDILKKADIAMYKAKKSGHDSILIYDDIEP